MNDFDLMLVHVKTLAETLMISDENMLSDEFYEAYCKSFDQLMQITENPLFEVKEGRLDEIKDVLERLEKAYSDLHNRIGEGLKAERLKLAFQNKYISNQANSSGYDKNL